MPNSPGPGGEGWRGTLRLIGVTQVLRLFALGRSLRGLARHGAVAHDKGRRRNTVAPCDFWITDFPTW